MKHLALIKLAFLISAAVAPALAPSPHMPVVWAQEAVETADKKPQSTACRPVEEAGDIRRCPRCCQMTTGVNECDKCGLKFPQRLVTPYYYLPRRYFGVNPRTLGVGRIDRSIDRSIRSINERVRDMKTNIQRIRDIDRQLGTRFRP